MRRERLEQGLVDILGPPESGVGQSRKPVDQRVNLIAELEGVGGLAEVGEGRLLGRVQGGSGAQAVEGGLRRVVGAGKRTVGTVLFVLQAQDRVEEVVQEPRAIVDPVE